MVRIKHRYILFDILYPSTTTSPAPAQSSSSPQPPAYVLFSRPSPSHISAQLLISAIRSSIQSVFGDHGLSVTQPSLRIVYFSPGTSTVILRVPRAHYSLVWASLTFMDTLPGPQRGAAPPVRCVARVVRVSGTIRKSEEEVLRRARRDIVRAKLEGRQDEDGDVVLEGLLDQNNGKRPVQLASLRAQEEEEGVIDFDYEQDMEDSSD
ncbi:uncharacterized protein PV06_09052 [Exophiala oligosperma]|uniref:Ribonuclease P/MRP protein subunit POP5 n=2 Tax=Chaetothyriales TaxID=34395 RepID=A0A0D2D9X0_9EURO|nr:uncharacterized protein PV06_09052 [Exophiala oligosperma]KAJ9643766.1 RNA-binding protein pop5 [Knufia peltigerae]KIW39265.1 hypothetical protein PV06_09052 [Exophiala oligosperma]